MLVHLSGFPFRSGLPLGSCLFLLSSTSFVCGCLPGFSPFGVNSGFPRGLSRSGFRFPFWWVTTFRPHSFRLTIRLFSLFPWCLSSVGGLGLRHEFPSRVVCVPALLILYIRVTLFLASLFSSLRPLPPAFRFFLVWILAGSPSLPCLDLSSLSDRVTLWDESVASVGSIVFSSGFLVGLLCTVDWFSPFVSVSGVLLDPSFCSPSRCVLRVLSIPLSSSMPLCPFLLGCVFRFSLFWALRVTAGLVFFVASSFPSFLFLVFPMGFVWVPFLSVWASFPCFRFSDAFLCSFSLPPLS